MKLNRWQREILKLERISDKDMNRKLYNAYNDVLKDVRIRLKAYMDEYEDLPYYKQQQAGKLSALEKEIVDMLNSAYPTAKFEVTDFKRNEMMDGYYSSMYQIEAETGTRLDFLGLDSEFVRQSVARPIAGKTLSNRLYKSRVKLANRATSEIRTGMMQGKTYAEIAGAISRHTEANYQQAVRIARTEGGRLRSLAKQEALNEAKDLGIDMQKRWYSSLDNRTRSSHRLLDGQTVEIDEDFVSPESGAKGPMPRMLGKSSEDINCRCTTVNIVDGIAPESRYAKGSDGHSYEKFEYENYNEWKDARVDNNTGNALKVNGKAIMSKTNMLEIVGEANFEKFTNHLSNLPDERLARLYETHGSDILYDEMKDGREFANGARVTLSQSSFDGRLGQNPLEVVYHENAHAMDRLGVKSITGENSLKTGNKKKIKVGKRSYEIDEEITHASALPKYNLKQTIHDDLWRYVNGDLPTYDSLGKVPRKKVERELYDKARSDIYTQNRANMAAFKENMLKLKESKPNSLGAISDIVESTGYLGEYPFGYGHGSNHWKQAEKAEAEFFAHVAESLATNTESYDLIQEIFPNSVKTWETIVDDMIKGVD